MSFNIFPPIYDPPPPPISVVYPRLFVVGVVVGGPS